MHTQPIYPEGQGMSGVLELNSSEYQVISFMNGYACELLKKTRDIPQDARGMAGLSLHDCYPSVFMQGEDATAFLVELHHAQSKLSDAEVGRLLLSAYDDVMH